MFLKFPRLSNIILTQLILKDHLTNYMLQLMISTLWILCALLFITKAEHLVWPTSENNPGEILHFT